MDDHVKLLDGKMKRPRSIFRNFAIIIYFCVLSIILFIFLSIEWQNIGQHINFYSESRIKSLVEESVYKVLKSEGIIRRNETQNQNITTLRAVDKSYRLNTKSCKMSDLPLFDEETRPLFHNDPETIYKCDRKRKVLIKRFDETWIHLNWGELGYEPACYYRKLERGKDDYDYVYGKFIGPLKEASINLQDFNFVHIVCYKKIKLNINKVNFNATDTQLLHNEVIPLIPFVNKTSASEVPNVLLLAIDATSYVNFKRHFIRTEKLLNKYEFFELRGYNKVGANTFPNMIPFLTGHHSNEIIDDKELKNIYFDDWPLIWKKYSEKGFVTTFLEEMSWCGLFHFNLWGFKSKPTDYQLRPFHMQIMDEKYDDYCYLDKTETETCLDWTYDYIKAMNKRKQKYFAYISISEMTHDWIEAGHYMDVPYYTLFSKLFNENVVENTLIIFFSDHGFRYGDLRQTHTGEVENRLPFIFIHLPENFDSKYAENLRQNQYRLTTPFDIHATLTHLIKGEPDHNLPHGLSLFEKVLPETRDCNSSSIPDMYCSCFEDKEVFDYKVIKANKTIEKIVNKINSMTASVRNKCSKYVFQSIHKLYERSISRTDSEYKLGDSQIFIVQLYVNPGMSLFETVLRGFQKNTRFDIIGEITRINLYGEQPHCLNDKLLNNYCFCRDLLN